MAAAAPTTPKPTALITGASGLLGRALMHEFTTCGLFEKVTGTAFSRAGNGLIKVDLTDPAACANLVQNVGPSVVIHAAAERRPDKVAEDPAAAEALNVDCVYALAKACSSHGAFLVLLSTDYVFDGSSPPYSPESFPKPVNEYGELKLRAEYAAMAAHPKCAVLRVPVLYGPTTNLSESAVTLLHDAATLAVATATDDGDPPAPPSNVDAWAVRTPTFTPDVARVLRRLCVLATQGMARGLSATTSAKQAGCTGIFHWSSAERCTKFDQTLLIARLLEGGASEDQLSGALHAVRTPPGGAPRPKNCEMDVSKLLDLGVHAGVEEGAQGDVPASSSPRGVSLIAGLRYVLAGAGVVTISEAAAAEIQLTDSS